MALCGLLGQVTDSVLTQVLTMEIFRFLSHLGYYIRKMYPPFALLLELLSYVRMYATFCF